MFGVSCPTTGVSSSAAWDMTASIEAEIASFCSAVEIAASTSDPASAAAVIAAAAETSGAASLSATTAVASTAVASGTYSSPSAG